jgi:hypothetical protein
VIGLPVPSLTATIHPPGSAKHSLGRVVVHGYTPPPRDAPAERTNARYRCARCVCAGLDGAGHSSRNTECPSRVRP